MRQLHGSTRGRLLTAALVSAVTALFMLLVNPFPTDVLGQTTPPPPASGQAGPGQTVTIGGVTFTNQGGQPCNIQVTGNQATIACPAGFTVIVQSVTAQRQGDFAGQPAGSAMRSEGSPPLELQTVAQTVPCSPVGGQPNVVVCIVAQGGRVTFTTVAGVSRQATTAPAAQVSAPAAPAAPAALPRTGASAGEGRSGLTTGMMLIMGLLALAAALGSGALVLSLRRTRR